MHHYYKFYKIIKIQNTDKENNLKILIISLALTEDLLTHFELMASYHSYKLNEFEQVVQKAKLSLKGLDIFGEIT